MKVSINWLKELVKINKPLPELIELINLRTLGTKEVTDKYIELDMKGYNRADLLSLRGVAYEVSAITGSKIKYSEPSADDYYWINKSLPNLEVIVQNEKLTPIYCLAKIEGVKVEKSPQEWIGKLEDSGYRSVNNIADLTNLLMLEYGQPMHAFDAGQVSGTFGVRLAKPGETILTLDAKKRQLTAEDLLIVDANGPIGIAGVMGGKDSEISETTTSVLLEAAIFDPSTLRKTATGLGLTSEASKRFYHGLAIKRLLQALDLALKELEKLGGKVTALALKGNFEQAKPNIPVSLEKINSLVGVEFKKDEVEEYLKRLNFEVKKESETSWIITPPYYRLDVSIEEDVIEELARMYGYEKIKPQPLPGNPPEPSNQSLFELTSKTRQTLADLGLSEVQTYSFYSRAILDALEFDKNDEVNLLRIENPISKETEYLRQNLWHNLTEAIGKNLKSGIKDIGIFEIGKVYYPGETPKEHWRLAIALMNGTDNPISELVSILKRLSEELNLSLKVAEVNGEEPFKYLFHPKRYRAIEFKGLSHGIAIAEIHPKILDKLGIKERVAVLEIGLEKFTEPQ